MNRVTGRNVFLAAGLAAAAAIIAWQVAYRTSLSGTEVQLAQNLAVTKRAVESEIERFRHLPPVVGEDSRIIEALARPRDSRATDRANRYLETVAEHSGAAQLYLLNDKGTAIAASNWATPETFVGANYGFRPYFLDALETGQGRYYAIGVTTGKPGYFLARRITADDGVIGAVVVKLDLQALEAAWQTAGVQTAIADRHGVIFLSGNRDWTYRPLRPLGAGVLARLAQERTYDGIDIASRTPLFETDRHIAPGSLPERLFIEEGSDHLISRFRQVEPDGWILLSARSTRPARDFAAFWAFAGALLAILATGIFYAAQQRRQIVQLRLSRHEELERKVAERTADLAREVDIRKRAEAELRAAQEGLIHSEKMAALGRMSTAIVHEVSQPLAAMEATLASAGTMASRDGNSAVAERLDKARKLIRRIQRTIKHLRTFSRKDASDREPVAIDAAVLNALDLARPRAADVGVEPGFHANGPAPVINAVAIKLEQVFLNLLLNALDAVAGQPDGRIDIHREVTGDTIEIRVEDNGSGIAPADLPRISEPFFTTKQTGDGLGLGLAISRTIVQEFGGDIAFADHPGGGTVVTVRLPLRAALSAPASTMAAE
jgi:two-component system C4-dicarboxylate transport sensor histidine kinase DctB